MGFDRLLFIFVTVFGEDYNLTKLMLQIKDILTFDINKGKDCYRYSNLYLYDVDYNFEL